MPDLKSTPDLDRILAAVREEARRRGSTARVGVAQPDAQQVAGPAIARRPPLPGEPRHVRDFLALSSEQMLDAAYRRLLQRLPDPTGLDNYRRALRTVRRTKIEVLGLIRFSAEGRRQGARVPGLVPAFALALTYRVPVIGWLADVAVRVLGLPTYLRNRIVVEQVAQETLSELEG